MIIAGIGARKTPDEALEQFEKLGRLFAELGGWVRSGHTPGADYAWERGAGERTVVYLPWRNFGSDAFHTRHIISLPDRRFSTRPEFPAPHIWAVERGREATRMHHPKKGLDGATAQLMIRNYFQIMGAGKSERPVDAVICWALVKGGEVQGGTGQAVRIAVAAGIPVFNLFEGALSEAEAFLRESIVDRTSRAS